MQTDLSDKKESAIHRWTVFHEKNQCKGPTAEKESRLGLDCQN